MPAANTEADHGLAIDRLIGAPRAVVWRYWTEPALLMPWHCPRPWRVTAAELDVRPGGAFDIVMEGPNGERHAHKGCYLEVIPQQRLVFTDAFSAGFMPVGKPFIVGHVTLTDEAEGTRMVWGARHWSAEDRAKHLEMGFEAGWNACADQLDELARTAKAG
jgi:uncharacterized protein YndB with AHSA1/START domain